MADAENIVNTGSPKIQIDSDGTGSGTDKLTIITGSGSGTELMRVQEDGIAVFTTSNHINDNPKLVCQAKNSSPSIDSIGYNSCCPTFHLRMSAGADIGVHSAIGDSVEVGGIGARPSDGNDWLSTSPAAIHWVTHGGVTSENWGMHMDFLTCASGSVSRQVRMRIASNGSVGIGTDTAIPDANEKLTVQTGNSYGLLHTNGTVKVGTYVDNNNGYLGTKTNHPLGFFTNNGSPQMVLGTNGTLDVNGNIRTTGDFMAATAGKGIILTNAAGTVTRRVRLNDAGNGFIFETP